MPDFFTTPDGLRLAYDIAGEGPPLLCLAGLTRNMDDFEPVVAEFSRRAQVIRLDSRGRGGSDPAPDPLTYTVPQEGADALALLDHLGIGRAAILGTSRGGLIAMSLAATAKQRLAGVVLNDIGPVIEPAGLSAIMDYLGRPSAYRSFEQAADRLPRALGRDFPGVSREGWLRYARRIWNEGPDRLENRYDPRLREAIEVQSVTGAVPDLWPLFDAFAGLPLALLRGENSNLLSRETMREMRRRRPDMIAAEVPDRGHVPFLDEAESVTVLSAFLDRVGAR
ncbi:alpha/beta fold hydrolase [Celeribacter indicus]|uniref:Alpha/beta hydrolase n=1 Tax=Celeribacter indicus TaxID=1208324 RepID=A0A0B5DXY7_9RHOB|nr:alpha/beta hydrolase [Celeribacter indicus]AJE46020.1 alpha/beta hydrolase [Celeribacter indicus]SDX32997.1 Pimeloyl-ACP methyl ester carboxylesterase [Celeribacter indicus]